MKRPTAAAALPDPAPLEAAWDTARAAWLASRRSVNTTIAYRRALDDWQAYIAGAFATRLWDAEAAHARAWQEHMQAAGLAVATIGQRMAAVSSFYHFVIGEIRLVEGIETGIFCDRRGKARANPFRSGNIERPHERRFGRSLPLAAEACERMLKAINTETVSGARDYALLLTFLYTGWRAAEVLGMRWGDIAPGARPGEYTVAWRGKGGKAEPATLPGKCLHAITRYLEMAGRPAAICRPEDCIWRPLSTAGCRNFAHVGELAENRAISGDQGNNILRKRLRLAGVPDPERYHLHSLRHTFVHLYVQAKAGDILGLSRRLHHASLAVTQIYLEAMQEPVDDYSAALEEVLGV